jgi:hypothetical protein
LKINGVKVESGKKDRWGFTIKKLREKAEGC